MKQRKETFNLKLYGRSIRYWLGDISEDDRRFVSNKAASLYKEVEPCGCVDNLRMSRVVAGLRLNPKYQEAVDNGCCGSVDRSFTNPLTDNTFSIGFNYGH